jgi:hypothetical protein
VWNPLGMAPNVLDLHLGQALDQVVAVNGEHPRHRRRRSGRSSLANLDESYL